MIDALRSASLPQGLDGLYIGGGFPETSARQLAENESFRQSVREAALSKGFQSMPNAVGLYFWAVPLSSMGRNTPLQVSFP